MIDDQHHITTPEGVPLTLDLAGPVPRALAYFTDLAIRIVVYIIAAVLFGLLGGLGNGLMLILIFLLEWFYPVWFEVMRHGQTPGKKSFGMAVVREDGTPVDFSASLVRNLLRTADQFPLLYLTGFVTMLLDSRFRRLGDLAAGTLVVYSRTAPARRAGQPAHTLPPDWVTSIQDRQLLLTFLERSPGLSPARRGELARLAFPELKPEDAEDRLRRTALHVQGGN